VQNEGQLTQPSATVSPWKAKLKRFAIWSGAVLAALGAAYGVGRFQTAQLIDAAEKRTAQALETGKATEQTLIAERNNTKKLEARRQLHLALIALDQRNFGIAQERLAQASQLLSGHSTGELEAVRAQLAASKLVATEDLEAQRGKILDLLRRFDAALPPVKAN
jgi:hypothetical protein